ncbi:MAG: hypothetical protein ABGY41_19885, partial [Candidatus Poribacteria bacterium]
MDDLEMTPPPTVQERTSHRYSPVFRDRAAAIAEHLPARPDIAVPSVQFLHDEIAQCITHGLGGAAITLSAIMVEFSLKYALYSHAVRQDASTARDASWSAFEKLVLGAAITKASEEGIITPSQMAGLREFKNDIRNPYLHYNIAQITAGVVVPCPVEDLDTGVVATQQLATDDSPAIRPHVKRVIDAKNALKVFQFATYVAES